MASLVETELQLYTAIDLKQKTFLRWLITFHFFFYAVCQFFDFAGLLDDVNRKGVFAGFIHRLLEFCGQLQQSFRIAVQLGLTFLVSLLFQRLTECFVCGIIGNRPLARCFLDLGSTALKTGDRLKTANDEK